MRELIKTYHQCAFCVMLFLDFPNPAFVADKPIYLQKVLSLLM